MTFYDDVPSDTKHFTKTIPRELFFEILEGVCDLKISGKEDVFQKLCVRFDFLFDNNEKYILKCILCQRV